MSIYIKSGYICKSLVFYKFAPIEVILKSVKDENQSRVTPPP